MDMERLIEQLSNWAGKNQSVLLIVSIMLFIVNPYIGVLSLIISVGIPMYLTEIKKHRIIRSIPRVAMTISELWGLMPIGGVLAKSGDPALEKAGKQILAGISVKEALNSAKDEEPELSELVDTILAGYRSGGNVSKLLSGIAERYSDEIILEEESKANHLIERLTLASSASVMVPFVIGSMIAMTTSMYSGFLETTSPDVRNLAILGSKIYVILFAIISGVYLGVSEAAYKKAILYSGLMVATAWLILNISLHIAAI